MRLGGFRSNKWLLRAAVADRLPPEILRRRKQAFKAPFSGWFRGALADFVADTLAPDRLRAAGLFDADAVTRLVREHLRGERDWEAALWSLIVFELWRAEMFRGDGGVRPENRASVA